MNVVLAPDAQTNKAFADWMGAKAGLQSPIRPPYRTMGIFDGSDLVGVVIFENYYPEYGTVEIGAASISPRWFSRRLVRQIADYAFRQLACQMAIFRTSEKNRAACRLLEKIGLEPLTIPRMRGLHEAENYYFMTAEAWDQNPLAAKEANP